LASAGSKRVAQGLVGRRCPSQRDRRRPRREMDGMAFLRGRGARRLRGHRQQHAEQQSPIHHEILADNLSPAMPGLGPGIHELGRKILTRSRGGAVLLSSEYPRAKLMTATLKA